VHQCVGVIEQNEVTENEFLAAYYQPFRAMFAQIPTRVEQITGRRVILVESDFADLSIGVAENALSAPDANSPEAADEKESGEHGGIAGKSGEREFLGIDGVFVRLGASWSDGLMRLTPSSAGVVHRMQLGLSARAEGSADLAQAPTTVRLSRPG
jgi:hypothetical protein